MHAGHGVVIRYLVFNPTRAPTNNPAVRKAIAYLMPRQTIATRVYHGFVKPLYSMVPAGLPGHIDAFATLYGRAPSAAKAKAVLQGRRRLDAGPDRHLVDADPLRRRVRRRVRRDQARRSNGSGLFKVTLKSAEWAQYSAQPGKQYNAFQLGWFPDYVDAENYIVPFYQPDNFMANGYNEPEDERPDQEGVRGEVDARRGWPCSGRRRCSPPRTSRSSPYWQGKMIAVSRSNVPRHRRDAGRRLQHAVLAALEVVVPT